MRHTIPLIILACSSSIASAQSACENTITYTLPDASSVKYVYEGNLAPSNTYDPAPVASLGFIPDRRPGIWFSYYGPEKTCTNPKGQEAFWNEARWDNPSPSPLNRLGMKQRLDSFVNSGFSRIIINRPGGSIENQFVQQAHFHHMTNDQKDLLQTDLADWIADATDNDEHFDFGVFIGSWQSGHPAAPCLANGDGTVDGYGGDSWDCSDDDTSIGFTYRAGSDASANAADNYMDPSSLSSMQETYQNIAPWLDIGCTSIWLDNSADSYYTGGTGYLGRDRTIDLIQSPDYTGVNFAGEAIPREWNTSESRFVPIESYLEAMPWMTVDSHLYDNGMDWIYTPDGLDDITVDPLTTEVIVVFHTANGASTLAEMATMRDRGFVIWVSAITTNSTLSPDSVDRIGWLQRIYPELTDDFTGDLADFNGDGNVDCDDYDLFVDNWYNSFVYGSDYNAIWDGDIDGDGDVDWDDVTEFGTLADWATLAC